MLVITIYDWMAWNECKNVIIIITLSESGNITRRTIKMTQNTIGVLF